MAKNKKLSAELKSALRRLNNNLDAADLKQFPLTLRDLALLQEYIDDVLKPMINSGQHKPETTNRRLKRDQKIIREAIQLLDDGVSPRDLANRIKTRLKLSLSMRQIRRVYKGK